MNSKHALITKLFAIVTSIVVVVACSVQRQEPLEPSPSEIAPSSKRIVRVSFYGANDNFAGKPTASGELFDPKRLTAAHRSLPFGSKVRLHSEKTNKSVVVTINDRGPFIKGREFDISHGAAQMLGIEEEGVATLSVENLGLK